MAAITCEMESSRSRSNGIKYLKAVVGPRSKFHDARLIVKRKVSDVHWAGGSELGRRRPKNVSIVPDHGLAVHVASRVVIRTEGNKSKLLPTRAIKSGRVIKKKKEDVRSRPKGSVHEMQIVLIPKAGWLH